MTSHSISLKKKQWAKAALGTSVMALAINLSACNPNQTPLDAREFSGNGQVKSSTGAIPNGAHEAPGTAPVAPQPVASRVPLPPVGAQRDVESFGEVSGVTEGAAQMPDSHPGSGNYNDAAQANPLNAGTAEGRGRP